MERNPRDYNEWVNEMANMQLNSPRAFEFAVSRLDEDDRSCLIGEGILNG